MLWNLVRIPMPADTYIHVYFDVQSVCACLYLKDVVF